MRNLNTNLEGRKIKRVSLNSPANTLTLEFTDLSTLEITASAWYKYTTNLVPKPVLDFNYKEVARTDDKCLNCGHSKSSHEMTNGYQPYGHCNHGWDLCSCKDYQ